MNDFEEQLKKLEGISEKLRNGEIAIDEATRLFEEGITLSRALNRELQHMEKRIEILMNDPQAEESPPEFSKFEEGL